MDGFKDEVKRRLCATKNLTECFSSEEVAYLNGQEATLQSLLDWLEEQKEGAPNA